jgi:hypothetical protein
MYETVQAVVQSTILEVKKILQAASALQFLGQAVIGLIQIHGGNKHEG